VTALVSPGEIIASGLCIGCGACAVGNPEVAMVWNRYGQLEPDGPAAWRRTRSARFSAICPFSPSARNEDAIAADRFATTPAVDARIGHHAACYVGAAVEAPFRERGSSGGMVNWVAAQLLRRGEVDGVLHVHPGSGGAPYFGYRVARSEDELIAGAKSRYHPIHLADVLDEVRRVPGRYAVIGIPCFIKAVHLARADDAVLAERIAYTLGLFCGHMKSARFVTSFAWQLGVAPDAVRAVEYRRKDAGRPANWYTAQLTMAAGGVVARDWWHLADGDWGAGYFQASACDFCDDVVAETADISFGDAWVEPYASDGRGTNVVVVRHPAIAAIVDEARRDGGVALEPVDPDFIVATQAAGFRQRREGLAYRLARRRRGVMPIKRVAPDARSPTLRRKLVYRARAAISRWSHRVALTSLVLGLPRLYIAWAGAMMSGYEALAYQRGRFARLAAWLDRRPS